MRSKRKRAANEIDAYGAELSTVIAKLKESGCLVSSVERMKGHNAGWIVRWYKPNGTFDRPIEGAVLKQEKSAVPNPPEQISLFPEDDTSQG